MTIYCSACGVGTSEHGHYECGGDGTVTIPAREIPFWLLPPVLLVIMLALILFPFRLLYERLTGRS